MVLIESLSITQVQGTRQKLFVLAAWTQWSCVSFRETLPNYIGASEEGVRAIWRQIEVGKGLQRVQWTHQSYRCLGKEVCRLRVQQVRNPRDRLVLWRNKPFGRPAVGVAKRDNENRNAGGHTWHLVLKTSDAF